jgi:hypothetical protein
MAKRILIGMAAALVIVYIGDYAWVRIRMRKPTAINPFQVVTTQGVLEVPHKDGRYEIILQDPQTQTCVHALFPHGGNNPCWSVARQTGKAVPMVIVQTIAFPGNRAK